MSQFIRLLRFELGFYLTRLSTWVYFFMMAALAYMLLITLAGAFPGVNASIVGTDGNVFVNSPHVILTLTTFFGLFGTLIVAAVAGNAGYRDFAGTHELVFTTPISRGQYFLSRYLGSVIVSVIVLSGVGFGLWFGSLMPFVNADLLTANRLAVYVNPYLLMILPNVLFASAIFLSMALLTRKKMPHYLGGAGLLLGYMVSRTLLQDLDNKWVAALTDPFGLGPIGLATEYWTNAERNTELLGLSGWLLLNRAVWVGLALLVVTIAFSRFRFSYAVREGKRRRGAKFQAARHEESMAPEARAVKVPAAHRTFGAGAIWAQFRALTRRALREVIASPAFAAILLAGVLFLILQAIQLDSFFGTRTWPMTWKVIETLGGSFSLFAVILITLYSGELVWRERDLRLDQVLDATPAASWIGYAAKLTALLVMVFMLLASVAAGGILMQSLLGYFHFEFALYAQKLLGMNLLDYALLCVLALAIHTLVNHKYTGHFILVGFYVAVDILPLLGFEHALLLYGSDLGETYSDMNRHGWYLGPFLWFKIYWAGIALMMAVLSNLLWPRGVDGRIRQRFQSAALRFGSATLAVAVAGIGVAVGAGGFIYYNTNVLNTYVNSTTFEALQARYEKEYRQYLDVPQPRMTSASLEVDLFPKTGDVLARGTYEMVNRHDVPVESVHVMLDPEAQVKTLAFGVPSKLEHEDTDIGYRIYALARPLAAGEATTLEFDLAYRRLGFHHQIQNRVVRNGTFVNSSVLPSFGYDPSIELALDRVRARHGLEPKERMLDLDDPEARKNSYLSRDADWVDFKVTVSTDEDQVALAPGYLQRRWEENGRHYFTYEMDAPILNFFSFLSARYEIVRDSWNDVSIEVYHHPGHEFNLDTMIEATKKSLDYFSEAFSPYQHRQVRILEFPRYASFAQSFPNTIPYSESIGFIARVEDEDINYPFYVTAHEVAHQWWAHQVIGANCQGSTVLSETLSQYSSLMVMEKEYGPKKMRKFMKYELDRYLRGRSQERKKELPLLRVENQQYIHYAKGSLVMYALKDAIGEEAVNRALARLIRQWGFTGPPYPTSRDLLAELRRETPEDLHPWLSDLFEHITLYENRATRATAHGAADGSHQVTLAFQARKVRAGEQGEETEVALNDPVDIGVFDKDGEPLYFRSHRLDGSISEITVTVNGVPATAGIDPYNKLIDRHPDDNEIDVEMVAEQVLGGNAS